MAVFGSLGGLGGMGSSFPMRYGAPDSGVVTNVDTWAADWERRYAAERAAARARTAQDAVRGNDNYDAGFNKAALENELAGSMASFDGYTTNQKALESTQKLAQSLGLVLDMGNTGKGPSVGVSAYGPLSSGGGSHSNGGDPGYTPNFSGLNREKTQIDQAREAGIRNQQAYDSMRGWGQVNGVMGPEYSMPGFGQINGIAGNPYAPKLIDGVDMGWTEAAYGAGEAPGMGVYSPAAPRKTNGWGLW